MNARNRTRWAALSMLLALGLLARPSSAHVFVDLGCGKDQKAAFSKQVKVVSGQRIFLRIATLNRFNFPLVALCDVPLLKVRRHDGSLSSFRVQGVMMPGKVGSVTLAALCSRPGTFKVTAFLFFVNPFTGCLSEVADTVVLVCDAKDDSGGTKDGKQAGQGGKDGKQGNQGSQGGQQTGGAGGKDGTAGTGQTGGQGQQTGAQGGQQSGGKKDDGTGGGTGGIPDYEL